MTERAYALRFISGKYQGGEYPLPDARDLVIGRSSDLRRGARCEEGVVLGDECFVGEHASPHAQQAAERCASAGVPCKQLHGRVGDTRTPQPVFALARLER